MAQRLQAFGMSMLLRVWRASDGHNSKLAPNDTAEANRLSGDCAKAGRIAARPVGIGEVRIVERVLRSRRVAAGRRAR